MSYFKELIYVLPILFLLILLLFHNQINDYYVEFADEMYIDIEHEGLITDKWVVNKPAFWIIGNTDKFYLEINNNFTVKVNDFEYYNTNIGDFRNWTTTELRHENLT